MEIHCVCCEVGTLSVNVFQIDFMLQKFQGGMEGSIVSIPVLVILA